MWFVWDPLGAAANRKKHWFFFNEAETICFDDFAIQWSEMSDPHAAELLAYVRAWSEPDTDLAEALLSSCWTEASEIIGPGYHFKGTGAVLAEIERFHAEQPGCRAVVTSAFDTHGHWTRFTIAMIEPDGTLGHEGWDIVEQDDDGKIRRVITFWGPLPDPGTRIRSPGICAMNDDLPALPSIELGRYRHYKGGEYEVVGVVRHSESLEPLVLYRPLYGNAGSWVRPLSMFFEPVEHEGRSQPRFSRVAGVDASEEELAATVRRMESRLSGSESVEVQQLMQHYRQVVTRFERDLSGHPRDLHLAKASALMLIQAAAGSAGGTRR